MSVRGLKVLGGLLIGTQVVFALMYAFLYSYHRDNNTSILDVGGAYITISIGILILLGFGLASTYVRNFAVTGLILMFFILAFTLQYYFIVESLWIRIGLTNPSNQMSFDQKGFEGLGLSNRDDRITTPAVTSSGLSQAMSCSLALIVSLLPVYGRTGPFQCFFLCLVGVFLYTFNEAIFWKLSIADNGYTSRIFIFGSALGLISSLILGNRDQTKQHKFFYSNRVYQIFSFIGSIFIWIFIPALSCIDQFQNLSTYMHVAPLNVWFALSASTLAAYSVSILFNQKILVHDIIHSSYSGAIAYGALSNLNPNPFIAIFTGLLAGAITTILNTKFKKAINSKGIIDSQGIIFSILTPAVIGVILSSIVSSIQIVSPGGTDGKSMLINGRSFNQQGGYQLVGLTLAVGCGSFAGLVIGFLYKLFNGYFQEQHNILNDSTFLKFEKNMINSQKTYDQAPVTSMKSTGNIESTPSIKHGVISFNSKSES